MDDLPVAGSPTRTMHHFESSDGSFVGVVVNLLVDFGWFKRTLGEFAPLMPESAKCRESKLSVDPLLCNGGTGDESLIFVKDSDCGSTRGEGIVVLVDTEVEEPCLENNGSVPMLMVESFVSFLCSLLISGSMVVCVTGPRDPASGEGKRGYN